MIVLIAAGAFLATLVLGLGSLFAGRASERREEKPAALLLRSGSAGFFFLMVGALVVTALS